MKNTKSFTLGLMVSALISIEGHASEQFRALFFQATVSPDVTVQDAKKLAEQPNLQLPAKEVKRIAKDDISTSAFLQQVVANPNVPVEQVAVRTVKEKFLDKTGARGNADREAALDDVLESAYLGQLKGEITTDSVDITAQIKRVIGGGKADAASIKLAQEAKAANNTFVPTVEFVEEAQRHGSTAKLEVIQQAVASRVPVLDAGELLELQRMNHAHMYGDNANPHQVKMSLHLKTAGLVALLGAAEPDENEINLGLHIKAQYGANPTVDQFREALRINALPGNPLPTREQIEEGLRLARALGLNRIANASVEQIAESIRIQALPGHPVPTAAQINEGLRIHALAGHPVPSVAQIDEGIRLATVGAPNRIPNATVEQINEGIRIQALAGHPVPSAAQIVEGIRLAAAVAPNQIVNATVAQIDEGIRIHALPGNPVGTAEQINQGLALILGGNPAPTMLEINGALMIARLGGLSAAQQGEARRIHALAGNPVPTVQMIDEGLRIHALPGNPVATEEQINEGLRIHALPGTPVATEEQINEGLRIHALAGNPLATVAQIDEGIRLAAAVAPNQIVNASVAQIDESLRIRALAGHPVPSAAQIAEGIRLATVGAPNRIPNATVEQINEGIRIHALPGNPVGTAAQIDEGIRLAAAVAPNQIVNASVAQIDESLRIHALPGHPVPTAAQIEEGIRLATVGAPNRIPNATVEQINEGIRIHALPGNPVGTAAQIEEGICLAAAVAPNQIVNASVAQIDESLRIHALPGNPVGTAAQIDEGIRLAADVAPNQIVNATVAQIDESLRIHALPGHLVPTAAMIDEGIRLKALGGGLAAGASENQLNAAMRLIRVGIHNPSEAQVTYAIAKSANVDNDVRGGARLIGLGVSEPSDRQIAEEVANHGDADAAMRTRVATVHVQELTDAVAGGGIGAGAAPTPQQVSAVEYMYATPGLAPLKGGNLKEINAVVYLKPNAGGFAAMWGAGPVIANPSLAQVQAAAMIMFDSKFGAPVKADPSEDQINWVAQSPFQLMKDQATCYIQTNPAGLLGAVAQIIEVVPGGGHGPVKYTIRIQQTNIAAAFFGANAGQRNTVKQRRSAINTGALLNNADNRREYKITVYGPLAGIANTNVNDAFVLTSIALDAVNADGITIAGATQY